MCRQLKTSAAFSRPISGVLDADYDVVNVKTFWIVSAVPAPLLDSVDVRTYVTISAGAEIAGITWYPALPFPSAAAFLRKTTRQ